MASITDLGSINLPIPVWQLALYVGLYGFFMVRRQVKLCLLATYICAFYWAYYLSGQQILTITRGNTTLETAYIAFGLALAAFCLMALFYEEN